VRFDIVFSILHTRRDLHFRVLARSQRSLETSTVHIYKCTPEEIPSLFAAPVFPATSDVKHRHTEFDCHSRRNRRFSLNYEPLCPTLISPPSLIYIVKHYEDEIFPRPSSATLTRIDVTRDRGSRVSAREEEREDVTLRSRFTDH